MKNFKMVCEVCGFAFETENKMDACPKCGDYETTEINKVTSTLTEYEVKSE